MRSYGSLLSDFSEAKISMPAADNSDDSPLLDTMSAPRNQLPKFPLLSAAAFRVPEGPSGRRRSRIAKSSISHFLLRGCTIMAPRFCERAENAENASKKVENEENATGRKSETSIRGSKEIGRGVDGPDGADTATPTRLGEEGIQRAHQ